MRSIRWQLYKKKQHDDDTNLMIRSIRDRSKTSRSTKTASKTKGLKEPIGSMPITNEEGSDEIQYRLRRTTEEGIDSMPIHRQDHSPTRPFTDELLCEKKNPVQERPTRTLLTSSINTVITTRQIGSKPKPIHQREEQASNEEESVRSYYHRWNRRTKWPKMKRRTREAIRRRTDDWYKNGHHKHFQHYKSFRRHTTIFEFKCSFSCSSLTPSPCLRRLCSLNCLTGPLTSTI